eukprot:3876473-Rhodomonas_salina.5
MNSVAYHSGRHPIIFPHAGSRITADGILSSFHTLALRSTPVSSLHASLRETTDAFRAVEECLAQLWVGHLRNGRNIDDGDGVHRGSKESLVW